MTAPPAILDANLVDSLYLLVFETNGRQLLSTCSTGINKYNHSVSPSTGMYSEPIEKTHEGIKSVTIEAQRWINADGSRPVYFNWHSAASEDNDCSDCNCVAVVGRRLQYVIRPCGGAHRVRAICSARRQRGVVSSSSRRRKQSNDGRTPH
jgi:hypothetical protein